MIAPTTSSLRSAERASHQLIETTGDWTGTFFFETGFFPLEGVRTFPFGFPEGPDLAAEDGVLRGIVYLLMRVFGEQHLRLAQMFVIPSAGNDFEKL
jgi:hypothetical protein